MTDDDYLQKSRDLTPRLEIIRSQIDEIFRQGDLSARACGSARGPGADRHDNQLILFTLERACSSACSQS
jgi:hypothetical protein